MIAVSYSKCIKNIAHKNRRNDCCLAQELATNNTAMQAGSGGVRSSSACARTQTGEIFDDGIRSSELLTSIRLSNDMKKSCDVRPRITDGLTN